MLITIALNVAAFLFLAGVVRGICTMLINRPAVYSDSKPSNAGTNFCYFGIACFIVIPLLMLAS